MTPCLEVSKELTFRELQEIKLQRIDGGKRAMKTLYQTLLIVSAALALGGTAFAQVPEGTWTGNDTSDGNGNTGMGSYALGKGGSAGGIFNTASGNYALSSNGTGSNNTASGFEALYSNTTGGNNTASGVNALLYNSTGDNNTASGYQALYSNTTGYNNTASGYEALYNNNANDNTASGYYALYSNTTGAYNTAAGLNALYSNTTGGSNTASGLNALYSNSTGGNNTASGYDALYTNNGNDNTASGVNALYSNTTADYSTASGYGALYSNNGNSNTANGYEALYANTTGTENTASGVHALAANTTGSNNIAEGYHAGYNLTTGSNNIDIGSPGVKAESGVIRIGTITGTTSTQSAAYIAGIYGIKTATAGTAVFIDSSGQLGTVSSSIRYKEDIQPIAGASERLLMLRPVKFRYKKAEPSGEKPIQYGLIAEEVAQVYPELVVRDGTTGRIDGVRYDELAPMLLNEAQQQQQRIEAQAAEIRELKQQMAELKNFNQATQLALRKLQVKGDFVVQR
jgi:hypothetical protein